jgi:1,4-alpha-glucan branching enzyme
MFQKTPRKNALLFSVKPDRQAQRVTLAGDFNSWIPIEMQKRKDGSFSTELALSAGSYQYKFVVDGRWISDPDHNNRVPNSFGTFNSVVSVQ